MRHILSFTFSNLDVLSIRALTFYSLSLQTPTPVAFSAGSAFSSSPRFLHVLCLLSSSPVRPGSSVLSYLSIQQQPGPQDAD